MSALALPAPGLILPKRFRLDAFDFRRFLRPLRMDGQFAPYQPLQFEDDGHPPGYGLLADVSVTDDGDIAPSSGEGTSTITYNSVSGSGITVFLMTYNNSAGSTRTLSSATWNGNAVTILEQVTRISGTNRNGGAVLIYNGTVTGNLVLAFSGTVHGSYITKVTLGNLLSTTAVDTDELVANGTSITMTLSALTTPGVGGVRLLASAFTGTGSQTWTNATPLTAGNAATGYTHNAAYDPGDDGSDVSITNVGATAASVLGVSLR